MLRRQTPAPAPATGPARRRVHRCGARTIPAAAATRLALLAACALCLCSTPAGTDDPYKSFFETVTYTYGDSDRFGGVAAVVENGEIARLEGWGTNAMGDGSKFCPEQSVFPMLSVTKTVTAYTVLLLVDEGKASLDDRARDHLPELRIPSDVRLVHLLAQTTGLEERFVGTMTLDPSDTTTLETMMRRRLPRFTYEPGEVHRYSNWNAALLGLIIERITDERYEEAVRRLVFEPLGMHSSFFSREDHPAASRRITGTRRNRQGRMSDSEYVPTPHFYLLLEPAGGLMSTAEDMSRFVTHLLSDEVRSSPTLRKLFEPAWIVPGSRPSVGHGMFLGEHFGTSAAHHPGGFEGVNAGIGVFPDEGVGYVVATNWENTAVGIAWRLLADGWRDRDAAHKSTTPMPTKPGLYREIRYESRSIERLAALLGAAHEMRIADESHAHPLQVASRPNDHFIAVDEYVYRRVRWHERAELHRALGIGTVGSHLLMLPVAGGMALLAARRRRKRLVVRWCGGLALVVCGLTAIGLLAHAFATTRPEAFLFGLPPTARAFFWLIPVYLGLAAALLIERIWRRRTGDGWLEAAACVALLAVAGTFTLTLTVWGVFHT